MPIKIPLVPWVVPQVTLSLAQFGCVPALFSCFFLALLLALSLFPPTVAVTKGAAGSHDPVSDIVQIRPQNTELELF